MSVQDYMSALKLGKKEYHACVYKGKFPYLPVMENIIDDKEIDSEVSLGVDQIPLRLVVGTCNFGRTNAFADNFMPILEWGTEFAAKWASLSDSQVNEGIRDPIKVYEYMNKFYVLEGNKRVSVLKYFNAVTVNAQVIRKVPKKSDDPDVKIYYEFMDFYKSTKLNDIYFSKEGSFTSLMELVGITPGVPMKEEDKQDFVSSFLNFRNAYEARGGEKFDYPVGDAYLRFIHIHGYDSVKNMSVADMALNVGKTWAEFELLSENSEVTLKMDPVNEPKKNILSYLLPISTGSNKKLKVGFIYEKTPQTSEWCYAHELGRHYIDETFGSQIETVSITNVRPEIDDAKAIEKLIKEKTDLIFVTSSSMIMASLKMAIANPSVKILNCSLNTSHKYIRTYFARMFEAKFLTGIIAGAMSKSDKIGYVAGCPVFGTVSNINAFAMGVKFVNPDAKVYLEWSSVKDNNIEEHFKNENITCVSDQDMITPQSSARKFGLYNVVDGTTKHLAMPVWHWGVFYEKLIQSILSGSWKKEEDSDNVKALNYWWGMSAGVVDVIYSNNLPVETRRLVDLVRKDIIEGTFKPFADEMYDQNGNKMNEKGNVIEPEDVITMDWFMDNVVGGMPDYDSLEDSAKVIVSQQGVIDLSDN
ncbi:MAG: BMP family ABC transporter substrate-binding protein [Lachnospira sp.]|nr:BMP family ABC transporter substrate-binding protein [Lachnospira sp.]